MLTERIQLNYMNTLDNPYYNKKLTKKEKVIARNKKKLLEHGTRKSVKWNFRKYLNLNKKISFPINADMVIRNMLMERIERDIFNGLAAIGHSVFYCDAKGYFINKPQIRIY